MVESRWRLETLLAASCNPLEFMPGNSFDERFRVTTAGVSHGLGYLIIIEGCPPMASCPTCAAAGPGNRSSSPSARRRTSPRSTQRRG
jgi:hypothetical protein